MKATAIALSGALAAAALAIPVATATASPNRSSTPVTATPIQHVIVIIGENHSFDNLFATYTPPGGQRIENLLSEGIVTADGQPGAHYSHAVQLKAQDTTSYSLTPTLTGAYTNLPAPNTTYVPSGCDGQSADSTDARFPTLPNGPFQITKSVPYLDSHLQYSGGCEFFGAYVGDPLHRFYQMWQQTAGYQGKLNTWVANTAGDDNGKVPPAPIYQGGLSMGYYNMAQGDAAIFKNLAEQYAISDNYHQAVMGGTGANHIALGTGFAASYQNASGNTAVPPTNQIENPDPKQGTNNSYSQDGYAGGTYSNCSDPSAPGVGAIYAYLATVGYNTLENCQPGRYYLLNNYNPGYNVDGTVNTSPFTVPPQKTQFTTIGQVLSQHSISWGYYGEGYENGKVTSQYCGICDPMQYSSAIMTNPTLRKNVQYGLTDFISQAENGTLPAVSFLKPGDDDGHPGYSTLAAYEDFVARAIAAVQSNSTLWKSTAIFVTFDETGGYYDSGYTEPVSFFGDGPRVPMLVVSPYAKPGFVDHTYNDHVSVLKFIEANWNLPTMAPYSEDNLPLATPEVYVPKQRPAIGDLTTLFDFNHPNFATISLPVAQSASANARLAPSIGYALH